MRKALLSLTLVMAIVLSMVVAIAPPSLAVSGATDYSAIRQYFANNPGPALSNQSLVFDQGGHIVQVVTGKPGEATVRPAAGATIVPNLVPQGAAAPAATVAPAAPNMTAKVTTTATATAVATAPVPTKTKSPGFGVILVAISMMAALLYFSRKK